MTSKWHDNRETRRTFLRVGALPLLGLGLPRLLASEAVRSRPTSARNVILIWLRGGPSTIDMWDLKPRAKAEIRGEFQPISTAADGVQICEHLPRVAKQMDHCTLIRSVAHTIAEHGQGTEHMLTGNPISPTVKYPSIGSIVSSQTEVGSGRDVPSYVDLMPGNTGQAGYLGASHNPFVIDRFHNRNQEDSAGEFRLSEGFTVADLARRREVLADVERGFRRFDASARASEMSSFQQQALNILTAGKTRAALDIAQEGSDVMQRYGLTPLGRSALAARRLTQAGVRFVTIGMNGWDTHSQNFDRLRNNLLPQLDRALAALIEDLDELGLLPETVVYCAGEFNRTPNINPQGGRDHWPRAMSVLLAGGGFRPGFVHGSTDRGGFEPEEGACSPADVNATVLNQVGISPDTTLTTRSGRPMPLFRDASLLTELCK